MILDPRLKEWATPTQAERIDAVNEHGSHRKAAKALGVAHNAIDQSIQGVKKKAALAGYAPESKMVHAVPSPFMVKGVSTYFDADGNVKGQWVKSKIDAEQLEAAMREAVDAMMSEVPRAAPIENPAKCIAELCNLYTITDYHIGMRAWAPETGADWDLDIAERMLIAAFTHSVKSAPKAAIGVVNQLGDFLHFDSLSPVTPASGHLLDADSRYSKVVRTATRVLRLVIDLALKHHEQVIVVMAEGNHDTASSVWLRHIFSLLYENEPRVKVIDSESPFYAYQHGATMLAFHHGHLVKKPQMPLLFATRYPQMWGNTTKRYCHTGHMHHVDEKEHPGMKVIQHATLAAPDSYANRNGFDSEREITTITYHSKFGQVARNTVCPEMLT